MDAKTYINDQNDILITTRIDYWLEKIKLGIFPKQNYLLIDEKDVLNNKNIVNISFDKIVSVEDINYFLELFKSNSDKQVIAFHECKSKEITKYYSKHLVLGEKCFLPINVENTEIVEEITFLSLKTFKGKISSLIYNVKTLNVWNDKGKLNEIVLAFTDLRVLKIYNSDVQILDLTQFLNLVSVEIYNCKKLEIINFSENNTANVTLENSPKAKILGNVSKVLIQ